MVTVEVGASPDGNSLAAPRTAVLADRSAFESRGGNASVRVDIRALPFRRGALGGTRSRRAYLDAAPGDLPSAMAQLHHALAPGAPACVAFSAVADAAPEATRPDYRAWSSELFVDVMEGAGFDQLAVDRSDGIFVASAVRYRTLPDFVGPGMRLLICGLNPSLVAADAGFGFAGASNRFWKAAMAAGVVSRPRDPWHALGAHGVGMTDLVKRPTARAAGITSAEFRSGWGRVDRLAGWLAPRAVCFVGLQGWRAAVNPKASPGWQPEPVGGVPAYVMASTSGLNARSTPADLTLHLRRAVAGP